MQLQFKDNFIGYLKFYRNIVGNHLFYYLMLTVFVGLLDGFGLAMFIPLLTFASGENPGMNNGETMGNLKFLIDGIHAVGLPLTLNVILFFLVFIFAIKGILRFLQTKYMSYIRFLFLTRVRNGLLDDLQHLSYSGFTKIDSGRIQNNLVAEVVKLYNAMTNYFSGAQTFILLTTYVALAFIANWQFAILIGIGSALTNFIFKRIYTATRAASKSVSVKGHDFNAFLIQAVVYFKYLKATNYFDNYANKLRKVIVETERLNLRMGHYSAILMGAREPLTIIIISLVIGIQVSYLGGSLGSIIVSLLFFYRALTSLTSLQTNWQTFIQNVGSMDAVSLISTEMQREAEKKGIIVYELPFEKIVTKDLGLAYDEKVILKDVNIEILKNQTVAFVGESGAGKTSLVNLLAGLIQPSYGKILIDGETDLLHYNLDEFRSKIGYITQDPVIFNDTLFNNITFWEEPNKTNLSRFYKAIEMASLTKFIQSFPKKEHTVLGDHGILVSGGQKQRISIARELYKNVDLLILDEATSSLDSETEQIIKENLENLKGKYTLIIIAHRLSTIKNADKIYFLANGTIQNSGTFENLAIQSRAFKKMVELQNL